MRTNWVEDEKIVDVILGECEYSVFNDCYEYSEDRVLDVAHIIARHFIGDCKSTLFVDEPQELDNSKEVLVSVYFEKI